MILINLEKSNFIFHLPLFSYRSKYELYQLKVLEICERISDAQFATKFLLIRQLLFNAAYFPETWFSRWGWPGRWKENRNFENVIFIILDLEILHNTSCITITHHSLCLKKYITPHNATENFIAIYVPDIASCI